MPLLRRLLSGLWLFLPAACVSARADLIAQWTFDQMSLAETSGFHPPGTHDGVTAGSVRYSEDVPPGSKGYSLELAPTAPPFGVTVKNSANTEPGYRETFDEFLKKSGQWTLTFWIKGTAADQGFPQPEVEWTAITHKTGNVGKASTNVPYFGFGARFSTKSQRIGMEVFREVDRPARLLNSGPVLDGQWHHIAFVFDGETCRSYDNGALQATMPARLSDWRQCLFRPLTFGGEPSKNAFRGKLDDIRIYNHALDEAALQGRTRP
jgi:hypothetical protein